MRKIYILFAFVTSTIGFAQTTEIFNNSGQSTGEFANWELIDNVTTNTIQQNAGTGYLLLDAGNPSDIVITSNYNISDYTNLQLKYSVATYGNGTNNSATVSISYDNGITYSETFTSLTPTSSTYLDVPQISLTPTSSTIKIKFANTGTTGRGVRLKNIILTGDLNQSASPILSTSVTAINNFEYIENEGPSESQQFTIYGSNLDGTAVIATAPTNFEVSIDNVTFEPTVTLPTFNGTETPIHARLISGLAPAEYSGNITISGGGINSTLSVALTGEVFEAQSIPALSVNTTNITGLTYVEQNGPSLPQSFQITGINTNGIDVTVTAPTAFLVSLNAVTYSQYVTLENFNGAEQIVYVYLASELQEGNYNGEITISAGSIPTPLTISVSGTVTALVLNPELTIDTTEIAELIYNEGEGPSESESFNLSGSELDGTNVVIVASENFEVSVDNTNFLSQVTLPAFDGLEKLIYVRLASDLTANTYTGNLTINGGGTTNALTISLAGEVIPTASIKENNIEGLKVYPNPASDLINISSNELGSKEVIIFNVLGKKVLETSTEETVNVSNLTSGVYIINITQDGKKASRKLIIK